LKRVDRRFFQSYIRPVGPVSKVVAVCLATAVLAGAIVLSAAAGGGYSGGDSGTYQYGSKPACKQYKKKSSSRSQYGYAKDCPKYKKKSRSDH
jgi:hypothetical protein